MSHCMKSRELEGRIATVKQRWIIGKEKMNAETEKDQTNDSAVKIAVTAASRDSGRQGRS